MPSVCSKVLTPLNCQAEKSVTVLAGAIGQGYQEELGCCDTVVAGKTVSGAQEILLGAS